MAPLDTREDTPEIAAARRAAEDLSRLLPEGDPARLRAEARLSEIAGPAAVPAASPGGPGSRKAVTVILASAGSAAALAATLPLGGPLAVARGVLVWASTVPLDGPLLAMAALLSLLGCLAVCGDFFAPAAEDEYGDGPLRSVGYALAGLVGVVTVFALASGDITKTAASWGLALAAAPVLLSIALPVAWILAEFVARLGRSVPGRGVTR